MSNILYKNHREKTDDKGTKEPAETEKSTTGMPADRARDTTCREPPTRSCPAKTQNKASEETTIALLRTNGATRPNRE